MPLLLANCPPTAITGCLPLPPLASCYPPAASRRRLKSFAFLCYPMQSSSTVGHRQLPPTILHRRSPPVAASRHPLPPNTDHLLPSLSSTAFSHCPPLPPVIVLRHRPPSSTTAQRRPPPTAVRLWSPPASRLGGRNFVLLLNAYFDLNSSMKQK